METTKEVKVRGVTIVDPYGLGTAVVSHGGRGQVNLQSSLRKYRCLQGIDTIKMSGERLALSTRLGGQSGRANAN